MPIPSAQQIAGLAIFGDIPPPHNMKFSMGLGAAIFDAFSDFVTTAQVAPGIPTNAVPPANIGHTIAPGKLISVAKSPQTLLFGISGKTSQIGLDAKQKALLDKMLAEGIFLGLSALSNAMIPPGIVVSASQTASPGKLMAPMVAALQTQVEQKLKTMEMGFHIPAAPVFGSTSGQKGACLPKEPASAIAQVIAKAFSLFVDSVIVMPGIPCAPGVTVGPGKLQ